MRHYKKLFIVIGLGAVVCAAIFWFFPERELDFNAEVRPILNTKCISCHGGVKESAGFSLFSREDALRPTDSGKPAIIPGDPNGSELIKRLTHKDLDERMPYHAEPLTPEEIETLRKWISQGANWQDHWAYLKPVMPAIPENDTAWAKNPVDEFILAKLKQENLQPSPEADQITLLRRLTLDLTGLPPTENEIVSFQNDKAANAYEKQVDRLLASPHYGERWAAMWLDLARYADSKGYEKDQPRNVWQYRDYVINSFNKDKPFDRFTIEQLAGDLLPKPTENQLVATAYHRNTTNNDEGGTDDEEFRTTAVIDRNSNTWEVWQGTTMGCVQCHSHPYDPVRHEEFYESLAFFNNTRDEDNPDESPTLTQYQPRDQANVQQIKAWVKSQAADNQMPAKTHQMEQLLKLTEPKIHAHSFDTLTNAALADGKFAGIGHRGFARLKNVNLTGKRHLLLNAGFGGKDCRVEIRRDRLDGEVIGTLPAASGEANVWNSKQVLMDIAPTPGRHTLYVVAYNPKAKNPQDYGVMIRWIHFMDELPGYGKPGFASVKDTILALLNRDDKAVERTPILLENSRDFHRKSFVFTRGNWLTRGSEVQPGTPKFMAGFGSRPKNRLGLAQWLVGKDNTLTARVTVNRFWEQLFGTGLVETLEDFGSQGANPSHPELLDYLALTFQNDQQWRVKKLLRLLVTSATYRQSSKVSKRILAKDAANRYLARGPRVRLTAEQVRDQALAIGGELSLKMHGKSVMPPQPNGVWQVVYSGLEWKTSQGEDAFRRAIYTFWRRSTPYPSLMTFDAAARDVCVSRRIRTNTPLQALVTLNDTVYITAARGLANRMRREGGQNLESQLKKGYQLALFKQPDAQKLKVLSDLYSKADRYYRENPEEINRFLGRPATKTGVMKTVSIRGNDNGLRHLACLSVVANAIMNLDEFVMKE